jgi:hypothetical protein
LVPNSNHNKRGKRSSQPRRRANNKRTTEITNLEELRLRPARLLNEIKTNDNFVTGGTIAASGSGSVLFISDTAGQGVEVNQFLGRRTQHAFLRVDVEILLSAALAGVSNGSDFGQVSIVLDRFPNGTLPIYGTIFNIQGIAGNAFTQDQASQERFKVLAMKRYDVTVQKLTQSIRWEMDLTRTLKGRDRLTTYAGTTGAIGSVSNGAIYLCFGGAVSANMSLYTFASRYGWFDA